MSGLDVIGIRDTLLSHALSLGMFSQVSGHEPKAAPIGDLYGALWMNSMAPARGRSGLASTTIRLEYWFRIGTNMIAEPQDDIDPKVLVATAALMMAYSGDFELGGLAEEIDLLGMAGEGLGARAGYLDQDGRLYRIMTITIPIIVSDVFDQSP